VQEQAESTIIEPNAYFLGIGPCDDGPLYIGVPGEGDNRSGDREGKNESENDVIEIINQKGLLSRIVLTI